MTIRLSIDRLVIEDSGLVRGDRAALEAALVEALQAGLANRAAGTQPAPAPQRLRRIVGAPPVFSSKSSAADAGAAIATSLIATLDSAGMLPRLAASEPGQGTSRRPALATSAARMHR